MFFASIAKISKIWWAILLVIYTIYYQVWWVESLAVKIKSFILTNKCLQFSEPTIGKYAWKQGKAPKTSHLWKQNVLKQIWTSGKCQILSQPKLISAETLKYLENIPLLHPQHFPDSASPTSCIQLIEHESITASLKIRLKEPLLFIQALHDP